MSITHTPNNINPDHYIYNGSAQLQKARATYLQQQQSNHSCDSFIHFVLEDSHFLLEEQQDLNFSFDLNEQDWDILIKEANPHLISVYGYTPLMAAFIYFKSHNLTLTAKNFDNLVETSNLQQSTILGLPALLYMFLHGSETPFQPTHEKIMEIFQHSDLSFSFGGWNVLHYALYYQKVGQTPVSVEHLDYLFEHSGQNLYPLPLDTEEEKVAAVIQNNFSEYEANKEKGFLQQSLPVKVKKLNKNNSQTEKLLSDLDTKSLFKL